MTAKDWRKHLDQWPGLKYQDADIEQMWVDFSAAEARVAELEARVRELADAAEAYSAEQESATHPKCGNVQPITVEEGRRLNECLAAVRATLAVEEEEK